MNRLAFGLAATLVAVAITFNGAPVQAAEAEACGAYRQSAQWGPLSHASVAAYVGRQYGGDWKPYVEGLRDRFHTIRGAQRRGHVIHYRQTGARLKGAALAAHVQDMAVRLAVTECLAKLAAAAKPEARRQAQGETQNFNNFATAAGGAPVVRQAAVSIGTALRLNVTTECEPDTVVFRVHNTGRKWPKSGELKIFRLADEKVVAQRNIRLGTDQRATYRVKRQKDEDTASRQLGMFIAPTWYRRPFTMDAVAECGN